MKVPMQVPSVITALTKTSVKINRVLIPGRQAANALQRYCRPVCFYNEGSGYEISSSGSSFLFRYRGHLIAMCAKHQFGKGTAKRSPDDYCIIIDDGEGGKVAVTPSGAATPRFGELSDYGFAEDIYFIEYEYRQGDRKLDGYFVDINFDALPDLRTVEHERLIAIFSIGYPSESASYDFTLDGDFLPQDMEVTHRFSRLIFSNDWTEGMEFHLTLRQHEKYPKTISDLDGFSGSPVFFFFKDGQSDVQLGFAGMMRLGSNGKAHVYEASQIRKFLDHLYPKQ